MEEGGEQPAHDLRRSVRRGVTIDLAVDHERVSVPSVQGDAALEAVRLPRNRRARSANERFRIVRRELLGEVAIGAARAKQGRREMTRPRGRARRTA